MYLYAFQNEKKIKIILVENTLYKTVYISSRKINNSSSRLRCCIELFNDGIAFLAKQIQKNYAILAIRSSLGQENSTRHPVIFSLKLRANILPREDT